jgi:hypothetical protein
LRRPEFFSDAVAMGKVHSKYLLKQSKEICRTPVVSASPFEVGNDPALTIEAALVPADIALCLTQLMVHGPNPIDATTYRTRQVSGQFLRH